RPVPLPARRHHRPRQPAVALSRPVHLLDDRVDPDLEPERRPDHPRAGDGVARVVGLHALPRHFAPARRAPRWPPPRAASPRPPPARRRGRARARGGAAARTAMDASHLTPTGPAEPAVVGRGGRRTAAAPRVRAAARLRVLYVGALAPGATSLQR